ncbi:ribonuclease Y [bacterium]|nr:ribonuclease Y [bacterium]
MENFYFIIIATICLAIGSLAGYLARQSIAKKKIGSIEEILQRKISQAKSQSEEILERAKRRAASILNRAQREEAQKKQELLKIQNLLLEKEKNLNERSSEVEKKEKEFEEKIEKVKEIKESLEKLKEEAIKNLERISGLKKSQAKKELLASLEAEYQKEILERMRKLEREKEERFQKRAKEILATVIQKLAVSQAQELTTTTVSLPNDDIKGRIIGKEGRNIQTFERVTGVELIVDEAPGTVIISAFDPVRRQIARIALERLIADGRIQPARIEDMVQKVKEEIADKIKEFGEQAVYDVGIVGLDPKLINLLGRLYFRQSYGQSVLLHSIEVAHLAGALAEELGADAEVAKKAGLLHDIGKAVDHQIEGSHVDIGIRILEKFGVEKEVIDAMKSHHDDYPPESLEAVIVQVADAISGSRPGARKDTLENYLKRLEALEKVALSFEGVQKAYALQAGREIRVFVKPEEVDDLQAKKLARDIAKKIESELRYPGEIKVTLIREARIVEYAR